MRLRINVETPLKANSGGHAKLKFPREGESEKRKSIDCIVAWEKKSIPRTRVKCHGKKKTMLYLSYVTPRIDRIDSLMHAGSGDSGPKWALRYNPSASTREKPPVFRFPTFPLCGKPNGLNGFIWKTYLNVYIGVPIIYIRSQFLGLSF